MLDDVQRPLNSRGKRDAPYMADMMVLKESRPDLLISSTAVRARKTATQFRKAFDMSKKDLWLDARLYHASPQGIIDVVRELPDDIDVVYVFGHNPGMTDLANHFGSPYIPNVPTCGIIKVQSEVSAWYEINQHNATRTAFYYPKQFANLQ